MRVAIRLGALLLALAINAKLGVAQEQDDEVGPARDQSRVTYSGYTLYRAQPQRSHQLEGLRALFNDKVGVLVCLFVCLLACLLACV